VRKYDLYLQKRNKMKRKKSIKYVNPLILGKAVKLAIEYCRIYGFDFHTHVIHRKDNGKITGLYILNEGLETAIKTIEL